MSVATPDVFFGQHAHSAPFGNTRCPKTSIRRSRSSDLFVKKNGDVGATTRGRADRDIGGKWSDEFEEVSWVGDHRDHVAILDPELPG